MTIFSPRFMIFKERENDGFCQSPANLRLSGMSGRKLIGVQYSQQIFVRSVHLLDTFPETRILIYNIPGSPCPPNRPSESKYPPGLFMRCVYLPLWQDRLQSFRGFEIPQVLLPVPPVPPGRTDISPDPLQSGKGHLGIPQGEADLGDEDVYFINCPSSIWTAICGSLQTGKVTFSRRLNALLRCLSIIMKTCTNRAKGFHQANLQSSIAAS